jgi:hypothetical protein
MESSSSGPLDAGRLSIPIQLAILLGGILVSLTAGYWTGQVKSGNEDTLMRLEISGLRSDLREGFTKFEGARNADSIVIGVLRRDVDEVMQSKKLHDIQIRDLREMILAAKQQRNQ